MMFPQFINWARVHVSERKGRKLYRLQMQRLAGKIRTYDAEAAQRFEEMRDAEDALENYLIETYPEVFS